jgi:hypothetical protein
MKMGLLYKRPSVDLREHFNVHIGNTSSTLPVGEFWLREVVLVNFTNLVTDSMDSLEPQ